LAQDLEVRLPAADQLAQQSELSESEFYALYSWCLNPILSIAGLVKRLLEELDRYPKLVATWQREESRINLYLFICAIACTVDDYLAWEPWNLTRVAMLPLAVRPLASGALWLSNSLHALRHVRAHHRVGRWRRDWEHCVDQACQLLLSGDQSTASEWAALESRARRQLAQAPFPADLREWRMRIPEGFRCQDLAHQDVLWLAQRFVESGRGRGAPLVVIGARTAGAYFAPLVRAALSRRGWPQASCLTVRPKSGLSRREWSRIKSLGRHDTHVVLVDDYPNTGITFRLMLAVLNRAGVNPDRITLLLPRHAARPGWSPDGLAERPGTLASIVLEPEQLHKADLLNPASAAPLLARYFQDRDEARIRPSPEVTAINRRLWEHYADGFEVRLKRLYELELTRSGAPPERRRVLAKSVGWGWLGYHAYIIGRRLAGSVPPVIGLRNGLLLTDWLDGADGNQHPTGEQPMTPALASYVARRARQLPVGEDPCFESRGYRWTGWDELAYILRGVYGPYLGQLKRGAIHRRLARYVTSMPAVVDGRMRRQEWIETDRGIFKVDVEHHNFGGAELDIVDPAYDLAAAVFEHALDADQERLLLVGYARESGDRSVTDRFLLYQLLCGVVIMRRAAEGAAAESRLDRREEWNRRCLWARDVLIDRMNRFHAALGRPVAEITWTKRLFFVDLDGVFDWERLGFPHTTPSGVAALDLLRAHDFSVVLNTGRSVDQVRRYCAAYRLPGGLAEYGSVFVDAVSGSELPLIDDEAVAQLERCRARIRSLPGVCIDPAYRYSIRAFRYEGRRTAGVAAAEMGSLLARSGCDRLAIVASPEDTYVVQQGVGKGPGVRSVREHLGCGAEPVAVIGDSSEDVEALECAELGYAPANCAPSVRALVKRGRCRLMKYPLQRGLLAAAQAAVGRDDGVIGTTGQNLTGASQFLISLLTAAERSWPRQVLALSLWWAL
jgi:hypothetical protein